jgi:signal transduction histidine kinase
MASTTPVEAERLRIARELHDIVAYSFATISVQAGVAAHAVGQDPQEAAKALGAIREISGEATREFRALLGLMRTAAEPDAAGCGVDGLHALAETMTSAGLPTRVTVAPGVTPVPAAVDRAAYGIAREALTNALRHAGPARAAVTVHLGAGRLVLEIADDGAGGGAGQAGLGIAGMRERALGVGGDLEAGPLPAGGFRVRAVLPAGGPSS